MGSSAGRHWTAFRLNAGLADARIAAHIVELGATVQSGSPAEFGRMIAQETEKRAKVVKASGAKAQ